MSKMEIKKVFIDTKFMTENSVSTSDFSVVLPQSIQCPENCIFYVDEISIPNAWQSIEQNVNDRLYFRYVTGGMNFDNILTLDDGSYDGFAFATELKTKLNSITPGFTAFNVTYDEKENNITVSIGSPITSFKFYTDKELKSSSSGWLGASYDKSNLKSINDVIRNYSASTYSTSTPFESGFLNFLNYDTIYLSSSNLGNFNTLHLNGHSNIIKKILVGSSYGTNIIERLSSPHDFTDCSRQQLNKLSFKLIDTHGNTIPLHNSHWSFSIIFSVQPNQD